MAIHKEQIKSALTQVVHPQYGKDLITLNLVQDLIIQEKYVSFTLELPRKDDRLSNQLIEESTRALKKFVDPDIVADITVGINISLQRELEGSPDQAQPQQAPPEPVLPGVKHVIAVSSGKGGVGKSSVTVMAAIATAPTHQKVCLHETQNYGPSLLTVFRLKD